MNNYAKLEGSDVPSQAQEDYLKRPVKVIIGITILLGLACLAVSAFILIGDIIYELFKDPRPHNLERWAIFLLIPATIFFFIGSVIYAWVNWRENAWRHVAYQIAAFLILALSLRAFGVLDAATLFYGNPEEDTKTIAKIASIMVLFLLAELAAFVGHDVNQAKRGLENLGKSTLGAATAIDRSLLNLKESLRLSTKIAILHPTVSDETVKLVAAWGERVPAEGVEPDEENSRAYYVSSLCWRILLREYLKEELSDIAPNIASEKIEEGIPGSVKPLEGTNWKDVSFIATNVGFYAKFLSNLVEYLSSSKSDEQKLCMAIVTNMLPAHCWDWPMPDGRWCSYKPIDSYRKSMIQAVDKGSQIDRVLLVYGDTDDPVKDAGHADFFSTNGTFWRRILLDEMLTTWHILSPTNPKNEGRIGNIVDSVRDPNIPNTLGTQALALFPKPIQDAATQPSGPVYPVIVSERPPASFTDQVNREWQSKKLFEEYDKLHGRLGKYWRLSLSKASQHVFDGRHDIMFIGVGKGNQRDKEGLWANLTDCEWGVCLMSSMNPTTQTMFLTVISGQSVEKHYEWCQKVLNNELAWDTDRLNPEREEGEAVGEQAVGEQPNVPPAQ